MFSAIFQKPEPKKDKILTTFYKKLKDLYKYNTISEERKDFLTSIIEKHGYLPYSHIQALEELTEAETLYGLEIKWKLNGIFKNNEFNVENENISPVSRCGYKNSDWIKREQHNIKLINLAALGDGNKSFEIGKFIDWLKQILILPVGDIEKGILSTTVYLIPFHPREFGCAYLPSSASVSENLKDKEVEEKTGANAKEQVKHFVAMAQLAGHPVLYDLLPQTGRYSKLVLIHPHVARWFDVKAIINEISDSIDRIDLDLDDKFDTEDIEIVKEIYKSTLQSGSCDISEHYKVIYELIDSNLIPIKKKLSEKMLSKNEQQKKHKIVKEIVSTVHGIKTSKISREEHITKQGETIQRLIKEGLWPAPGGAWCSSGVPIFDKMSECGSFPTFKHFDNEGNDVSNFANLDCQTPYYFYHFDTMEYHEEAIDTMIKRIKKRQKEYNFDGIRMDHADHIVDEFSEKDDKPISYRLPKKVTRRTLKALKENIPHTACIAEYMLGGKYYKEYHQDMLFDVLWGDDIIAQASKTPAEIIKNNQELQEYNEKLNGIPNLSILKTYNNQDGEFREIDQYPGQLGKEGALFKWFKFKFIPGGKLAQRPTLFVDGDESFTKKGIESTIISEISLLREKDYDFFNKFDAINNFSLNCELTREGEAQIITETDDGFSCWMISKDPLKEVLLIAANYFPPIEKITLEQEDGSKIFTIQEGETVFDKKIDIPGDFKILSQISYCEETKEYVETELNTSDKTIYFEKLEPSEYKIYRLTR